MCDNNGTRGACYSADCPCCRPRHKPQPVDTRRRTGRTSNAIKQAVFAASFGRRVAYISATQQLANDACRFAAEYIAESLKELVVDRVTVSKDCIQFYFANGTVAGRIVFRGMDCEDSINRGMRTPEKYRVVRDHYVDEVWAEREAKRQRMADCDEIIRLMQKHGFTRLNISDEQQPVWVRR